MSAIDLSGKLITLEGLDYTGKSTIVDILVERLRAEGHHVVATREPGGTPVGEKARQLLLTLDHREMLPLSELLLFMVSRAQHVHELILPALDSGACVLTSRHRLSSMAYQGYGRGISLDLIRQLNEATTEGRRPDLTLLIDVPVETALARKRGEGDRIEQEDRDFYERVRKGYLELTADDPRARVIDGTPSIAQIAQEIYEELDRTF